MIDFTDLPVRNKTYAGANGSKISVLYNNELYMLKFPAVPAINKQMSYANGCVSEYLGCHIFESIGIPVQKTLLGTYTKNKKQKIVVACKDFTADGLVLQDFASLKNTMIDSAHNGYGTELSDIVKTLDDPAEREVRIFERPLSGIKTNGQKIQYFKFISSLENKDCNKALKRILPKIDMEKIYKIIEETPFISNLQKEFYKTILRERKERILDFSYQKLRRRERSKNQER